jgi:hypothetical protein
MAVNIGGHAIGNVTNKEINWMKLNPMDLAPSLSSNVPPSLKVI